MLPKDVVQLFEDIHFHFENTNMYNVRTIGGLSITFLEYVIIVQREEVELPMSLFYATDFSQPREYQSFKLVIQIARRSSSRNLIEAKAILRFYDWQVHNFKTYFHCDKLALIVNEETPKIVCLTCKFNSCGCFLRFSIHQGMKDAINQLYLKRSRHHHVSLLVTGTAECNNADKDK